MTAIGNDAFRPKNEMDIKSLRDPVRSHSTISAYAQIGGMAVTQETESDDRDLRELLAFSQAPHLKIETPRDVDPCTPLPISRKVSDLKIFHGQLPTPKHRNSKAHTGRKLQWQVVIVSPTPLAKQGTSKEPIRVARQKIVQFRETERRHAVDSRPDIKETHDWWTASRRVPHVNDELATHPIEGKWGNAAAFIREGIGDKLLRDDSGILVVDAIEAIEKRRSRIVGHKLSISTHFGETLRQPRPDPRRRRGTTKSSLKRHLHSTSTYRNTMNMGVHWQFSNRLRIWETGASIDH